MNPNNSKTHAILDARSRAFKAKKIELLVKQFAHLEFGEFLEVGCGSGYIAHYFSELGFGNEGTHAVDVTDERQVFEGFKFVEVNDTKLPYVNNQFDLVVSNHVIEHVGSYDSQMKHLAEVYRTLKPNGVLYFAVPNKWQIIEPHYRLPFLSWFNHAIASAYVRMLHRGNEYDCYPLSIDACKQLLSDNRFSSQYVTIEAIQLYAQIEGGWMARLVSKLPVKVIQVFNPIIPTLIFVCKKN